MFMQFVKKISTPDRFRCFNGLHTITGTARTSLHVFSSQTTAIKRISLLKKYSFNVHELYCKCNRRMMTLTSSSIIGKNVKSEKTIEREDDQQLPAHLPVMVEEVLSLLEPENQKVIIDMTFGAGGHTKEILRRAPDIQQVITLDRDLMAFNLAQELSEKHCKGKILPLLGTFSELPSLLSHKGVPGGFVDGILFDVGVSSMQFDNPERGFSLSSNGPLDMRMAQWDSIQPSAADVVNSLDEDSLYKIIKKYGEEKQAQKIAHAIVESRAAFGKITETQQLANIVSSVFSWNYKMDKLNRPAHVATKTFQALRIFVNNELNQLNNGLQVAHHYLKPGGICIVVMFHSLEDRIVKRCFHGINVDVDVALTMKKYFFNLSKLHSKDEVNMVTAKQWSPVSKKVMTPTFSECLKNPRARSAKLRAAIKN